MGQLFQEEDYIKYAFSEVNRKIFRREDFSQKILMKPEIFHLIFPGNQVVRNKIKFYGKKKKYLKCFWGTQKPAFMMPSAFVKGLRPGYIFRYSPFFHFLNELLCCSMGMCDHCVLNDNVFLTS